MLPLFLALSTLLIAPLADRLVRAGSRAEGVLDGAVIAVVVLSVVVLLLPEAVASGGVAPIGALALGLLAGFAVHRAVEEHTSELFWVAALLGHSLLDGATIAADPHAHSLAGAVVLHNLPVGVAVWRVARRETTLPAAIGLLGGMIVATAVGYGALVSVSPTLGPGGLLTVQAGLAGVLLHPLLHLAHRRAGARAEAGVSAPGR